MERAGGELRTPPRDAMLSLAGSQIGRGCSFGMNGALDQAGATRGPLFVALLMSYPGSLRLSFAWLTVPELLCWASVAVARHLFPHPRDLHLPAPGPTPTGPIGPSGKTRSGDMPRRLTDRQCDGVEGLPESRKGNLSWVSIPPRGDAGSGTRDGFARPNGAGASEIRASRSRHSRDKRGEVPRVE